MTIRTRLTLWYAGVLSASLALLISLAYYELVVKGEVIQQHEKLDYDKSELKEILEITLWGGIPAALLGLLGGWFLMRKAFQPIREMTLAAGQMHEGNLNARMPRSGNGDEIDKLSEVFNSMTSRLEDSFRRVHEFALHSSHELKTPLTVLLGELENALHDEGLSPANRERVASEIDEVRRLARIVDGLTFLTKAGAGKIAFSREELRLDELVRDAYDDALVLAQPKGVTVTLARCDAIRMRGDRHRLRQLLLNLTDNAVKYSCAGGQVALSAVQVGNEATLTVSNTGPGVPPELQERVFEPFFRGDPSHSNSEDGCGLGLSICKLIAEGHGARMKLVSSPGVRTDVTTVFAAHYPSSVAASIVSAT